MNLNIVKQYISTLLVPRLNQADLSKEQVDIISNDISQRLQSLLAVWNDQDYISTLFEVVKEEALFYQPKCHISIRCLVVIGIRNSYIEDSHSTTPFNPLLKTKADNIIHTSKFIQNLTSEAIEFFKKNLNRNDNFSSIYQNTLFEKFDKKYQRAWRVLSIRKATSPSKQTSSEIPTLVNLLKAHDVNDHQKSISPVESGIDPNFDRGLLQQLKHVSENASDTIFFVPSFKHISRDIEKILKVIDFLIYVNVSIVTVNYLLTPENVFTRKSFLKPIHDNHEMIYILKNTSGVSKEHARHLRNIANSIS